ncbi:MAG: D-alanine--D-alanine ligase [Marinilabiliaceae bacterium]|nr:D-alanine--D-alanine ligase [Marinilabiliaceae bacterium]
MKKIIALIYGGYSSEEIVSKKSVEGLKNFIDNNKYTIYPVHICMNKWSAIVDNKEYNIDKNDFSCQIESDIIKFDYAYITIHGTPGEDGLLQGYFETIGIPYSNCNVLASAITFNKFTCNTYLKAFGVKVADSVLLRKGNTFNKYEIIEKTGLPCFVKPNAGGSSFGVSKVIKASEIDDAIEKAFKESNEVIIEQQIKGTELTCGLYKANGVHNVFPITEVVSKNDFFDYEAKYTANMAEEITPARIDNNTTERIKKIATLIYDILNCSGIIRVDFILSENSVFLLEVNTTPGMTPTSFIPQQIKAAGLNIKDVFTEVIEETYKNTKRS